MKIAPRTLLAGFVLGVSLIAGGARAEDARSDVEKGKTLYDAHCASCHGADGRGGGPEAAKLAKDPKDLTLIAARHDGTFPRVTIEEIVDGQRFLVAHGERTMPIWGDVFSREGGQHRAEENVFALVRYLESIQAKPKAGE